MAEGESLYRGAGIVAELVEHRGDAVDGGFRDLFGDDTDHA